MESEVTEEKLEANNSIRFNTRQLTEDFSVIDKTLACFESQDPKFQSLLR